jgi:hypothetical protein
MRRVIMANGKSPRKAAEENQEVRKPFKQMTGREKKVFLFQAVVCVCTLGFVFPNVFG